MNAKRNRFSAKKIKGAAFATMAGVLAVLAFNLAWGGQAYGSKEETVVVVQPGDTLWSIAQEHYPGKNIREAIYQIQKANGLHSANLEIGTVLRIPEF